MFSDPASAANIVRRSLEALLDELEVEKVNGKGKKLNLFQRIALFEHQVPDLTGMLNAIRFVGNEGSHSGDVSRADLMDSYEILDYVLDDLYLRSKTRARVQRLSQKVSSSYSNK
nr:DUF4145 domain-containing protein [Marinobacter sediminum]